jgi:hypothetical protein
MLSQSGMKFPYDKHRGMKFPDVVSNMEKSFLMLSEQGMMHSRRIYNFQYFESMLKGKKLTLSPAAPLPPSFLRQSG